MDITSPDTWIMKCIEDDMRNAGWQEEDIRRFLNTLDEPAYPEIPSLPTMDYFDGKGVIFYGYQEQRLRDDPDVSNFWLRQAMWDACAAEGYIIDALWNAGWSKKRIVRAVNHMNDKMSFMNPAEAAQYAAEYGIFFSRITGKPGGEITVGKFIFETISDEALNGATKRERLHTSYTWSYAAVAGYLLESLPHDCKDREEILSCLRTSFESLNMAEAREKYESLFSAFHRKIRRLRFR